VPVNHSGAASLGTFRQVLDRCHTKTTIEAILKVDPESEPVNGKVEK
jgi:hypothetical protein